MPPKVAAKVSAKAAAAADEGPQATVAEVHLIYAVNQNTEKPEIDWAGVAADCGFKNGDSAKVRYRQVKRKLGLDSWVGGKPGPSQAQDEDEDEDDEDPSPQTPATGRTKRTAPLTGTGAGVKKRTAPIRRGTATPSGTLGDTAVSSRTRRAKTRAILQIEKSANMLQRMMEGKDDELDDAEMEEDEMNDDDEMDDVPEPPKTPESPTRNKGPATRSSQEDPSHNEPTALITDEFADFPAVMPAQVLQREAILVHLEDVWTVSLAPVEVHTQWLSRLPADIQSRFYSQANAARNRARANAAREMARANAARNRARAQADADNDAAKNAITAPTATNAYNLKIMTYLANAIRDNPWHHPIIGEYAFMRPDNDPNRMTRQLPGKFGNASKNNRAPNAHLTTNTNPAMPPPTSTGAGLSMAPLPTFPTAGHGTPTMMPPMSLRFPAMGFGTTGPGAGRFGTDIGGSMGSATSMGRYVPAGPNMGTIPSTVPGPFPGPVEPRPATTPTPTRNISAGDTNMGTNPNTTSTMPNATIPSLVPGTTSGAVPPRPTPTDPETLARMAREQEERDIKMLFGDAYEEEDDF